MLEQPTWRIERAAHRLSGLASGGVYLAIYITADAVVSYTHRFTLTDITTGGYFLWHCPADRSEWPLATTLLCEVRTFLGALLQRGDPGDSSLPRIPVFNLVGLPSADPATA